MGGKQTDGLMARVCLFIGFYGHSIANSLIALYNQGEQGIILMIQYKVENITLTDDEKAFLIDLTIELEDYESDSDSVFISLSFPLAN